MVQVPQQVSQPASVVLDQLDAAQQIVSDEILLLERKRPPLQTQSAPCGELAAIDRAIEQQGQVLEILERAERALLRRYAAWNAVTCGAHCVPDQHNIHQQDMQHEEP